MLVNRYQKVGGNLIIRLRLEFNELVWAVTNKCNHYLIGSVCDVYTDNIALSYINSTHKLSAYE